MARLVRPRSLSYSVHLEPVTSPSLSGAMWGGLVWGLSGLAVWSALLATSLDWFASSSVGFASCGLLVAVATLVGALRGAR
ncbi:MAG TPA: hypothetical protein VLC09_03525 [Polyangiaceae bacterium]|nr:hypothetical protein [Polyangiaceae bacterium]